MSKPIRDNSLECGIAHFVVSVELDAHADDHTVEHHRELAKVTKSLIETFNSYRIAATWGVSDPAFSASTALVTRSTVAHEIAILGDSTWVGATAGRTRFARELERRVKKSRSLGIDVTSLIPRVESVDEYIDLVVKQEIRGVSGVEGEPMNRRLPSPRALHYGVWELPVAVRLPKQMPRFVAKWSLTRMMRRALSTATTFHLQIDAPSLALDANRGLKVVEALAQQIAEWKKRRLLCVETLGTAARRLAVVPTPSPQRSILRVAA